MARYKLAPSLDRLFSEIDAHWPNRDRRTDGWYNPARTSYGHNAREHGLVHAIDVDTDGVNPKWIVDHIYRSDAVLWYIIWNRTIWSNTRAWRPVRYSGPSPHTDHLHIEIYHTRIAENYGGHWNIGPHGAPKQVSPEFTANYSSRDYRSLLVDMGTQLRITGDRARDFRYRLRRVRGQ